MRRSLRRPLAVVSSTVAVALLLTVSAEAQRKKAAPPPAKKKPAATAPAKPKPEATKPAEEATTTEEKSPTEEKKPGKKAAEEDTESTSASFSTASDRPSAGGSGKPVMLDLGVGIRGFQRHLGYNEDAYGTLPSYDLSGAPEADLELGVFPIKNATGSITAGIVGSFGYAFALGSTYKVPPAGSTTSTKYTTKAMQFSAGGKANFNFGTSSVGVAAEFGMQNFAVDLPPPPADHSNAGVPDVAYKFIRPSLSARIGVIDKLSILVRVGYLLVLGAGEITTPAYFDSKNASIMGIDGSLGAAYEIAHGIEIRPAIDFRQYGYKFSWSPPSTINSAPYPPAVRPTGIWGRRSWPGSGFKLDPTRA